MKKQENEPRIDVVFDFRKKATEEKPGTVSVRVFYARDNRKYISTGVRVLPSQWSDNYWVVRHRDAVRLNEMIREQVEKCKEDIRNALSLNCIAEEIGYAPVDMPTAADMKVDRSDASFLSFMREQIEKSNIEPSTKKHHFVTLDVLEEWGNMRRFEDVTRAKIIEFVNYISQRKAKKAINGKYVDVKISQTTVHDHWKRLRKYIHLAQREGRVAYYVTDVSVDRGDHGERDYLTDEEIERWENVQLPVEYLRIARDRFIVQYCTGLSFADLVKFDFSHHEIVDGLMVINGSRTKSKKSFFVVVLEAAHEILKRWEYKVPKISNVKYNEYLERVAALAGINKHVTSHVGRHTYACYCLRHGVRIEAVQRTLGHTKISTTQIYAKLMDMDVVDAFNKSKLK